MTAARELTQGDDAGFRALMQKITRERGFLCASYKDQCLRRRIAVRMRARRASACQEYSEILDSDPGEYERLMHTLTVNVTKFFRNWETYSVLSRKVIPDLMDQAENEVRVWSAGCATGEEPYSIAILMHQNAVASNAPESFERISILGTDIDSLSLEHAARARYQDTALVDTPVDLRERYFREDSGFISPIPEARRPVTFESSDLLAFKAPIERAHLVVCRNVVIYFERGAQDALFAHFHEILEPGGYLVLGKVETLLGEARNMFTPVNARERIFRKA